MTSDALFCALSPLRIAELVRSAQHAVCYAGPGIQMGLSQAMVETAERLGKEMLTVSLDFDDRVMRMGYGDVGAVALLLDAGISVHSSPGLRTALIVVDDKGYIFTPTALYLEAEPTDGAASNAIRMSGEQLAQALARLSPAAKAIAVAQAQTPEAKQRIEAATVDVVSKPITPQKLAEVTTSLKEVPPVRFDLARQVRVFEPYLQYVELSLTGAAIQRHRLAIPPKIQELGGNKDLENRLRTTFELIEKGSKLSSKPLEDALNEIRKNLTPSLGKDHGRVVLKAAKPLLVTRLAEFRAKLAAHQETIKAELQKHLTTSRELIVAYYQPRVLVAKPDALLGQSLNGEISEAAARGWLNRELDRVFPKAEFLIQEMKLDEHYKDVTFETLNRKDFLEAVKGAFSTASVDWDKAYSEFRAAGQSDPKNAETKPA
jgi:CheY-like chemotaxis protein